MQSEQTIEQSSDQRQYNFFPNEMEAKTTTGFCDICGAQESGETETLQSSGWLFTGREDFCPLCND